MYTLPLDLHPKFVPPMSEHGPGIVLSRAVQLPFVPASSLRIAGASLDEHGGSIGFGLEELTWDVDREVFSASTQIICHDEPLALIPDTIRSWLDLGWELGSYADTYEQAVPLSELSLRHGARRAEARRDPSSAASWRACSRESWCRSSSNSWYSEAIS